MSLIDIVFATFAALLAAILYPLTALIDMMIYNLMYSLGPLLDFLVLDIAIITNIMNLCINLVVAIYDSRLAVWLVAMITLVVVLREYRIWLHGKSYAIFGWEITLP